MAFLVKLDEALSQSLTNLLLTPDYDARTVRGQQWGGTKDSDLWPMVQAEGAFFITTDKGFADLRHYPPGSHAGVLLLRPDTESALAYRELLAALLTTHQLIDFRGCTVVASPQSIRVRRKEHP